MNKQEVFNVILAHAVQMTEKSVDAKTKQCVYISPCGSRCFVGALLSPDTARACNPHGVWENVVRNIPAVREVRGRGHSVLDARKGHGAVLE